LSLLSPRHLSARSAGYAMAELIVDVELPELDGAASVVAGVAGAVLKTATWIEDRMWQS
jgi:hypothetical protein